MLANGKDVNYLMLNGEVFGSQKRFPAMYDLGKSYESVKVYNCYIDTSSKIIFSEINVTDVTSGKVIPATAMIYSIILVYVQQIYNNEKYILLKSPLTYTGSDWEQDANVWIKLKDVGGVLTPAK